MEKFTQYRDRGTQIAPFLPIVHPRPLTRLPVSITLLSLRLPFLLPLCVVFFAVLQWLPIGSLVRKTWLWMILLVSGVWWVDLQVEGVKKGSLSKQGAKLPRAGTVIVSSFTSPIDILYLAAVFDPIFTASYPTTPLIERLPLHTALLRALYPPLLHPPPQARLTTLSALLTANPTRSVALFPECTPTNGRGILRFSPSLDATPAETAIFPISIKYSPADVTTPIPGWRSAGRFMWRLLGGSTHCVRVRIGGVIYNKDGGRTGRATQGPHDNAHSTGASAGDGWGNEKIGEIVAEDGEMEVEVEAEEEKGQSELCERGAEALARIGRVKRLNLGVKEKDGFVRAWNNNRTRK